MDTPRRNATRVSDPNGGLVFGLALSPAVYESLNESLFVSAGY